MTTEYEIEYYWYGYNGVGYRTGTKTYSSLSNAKDNFNKIKETIRFQKRSEAFLESEIEWAHEFTKDFIGSTDGGHFTDMPKLFEVEQTKTEMI